MTATPMQPSVLDSACDAWQELLGPERVVRSAEVLHHYGRTTLADAPMPVARLHPADTRQISAVVRVAAMHRIALYPISRGRNWGWGDACPPTEGQVLLDLSDLDQIVEINEELGYVVLQPGVTQGQLVDALARTNSDWWLDCTAAGPSTSVLGNILERGITREERIALVSGMEVVLADGTVVHTGYGHFPASRVTHVSRWGIGPAIDGLFSQSNLGIVTELGLWLQPKPAHAITGYYTVPDDALETAIDTLRPFRIRGIMGGQPAFLTPNGLWFGIVTLQGSAQVVTAHREELEAALAPAAKIVFPSVEAASDAAMRTALLEQLGLPLVSFFDERLRQNDPLAAPELSPEELLMYVGGPNVQHLTKPPSSTDPLDHNYGFYFLWPTCPALGREVRALANLVRSVLTEYAFPPLLTFRFMTGRSIVLVVRVVFDRKSEERSDAARACHAAILDATIRAGYLPARVGLDGMQHLDPTGSSYWQLVRRLKELLDPHQILAPGRYSPSAPRQDPGR